MCTRLAIVLLALGPVGCATQQMTNGTTGPSCDEGGKCDTPHPTDPLMACQAREADAMSAQQHAFLPDAIRWACADVEGVNTVNGDSRGQEYCEYFALVQLPSSTTPIDLGRSLDNTSTTPLALTISDADTNTLQGEDPTTVVGQCIFTSWHSDIQPEYPNCTAQSCPDVMGFQITGDHMRMKISINSNSAANDLVQKCYASPHTSTGATDPQNDNYIRGCMLDAQQFGTEWRRSDPTICSAVVRLHECNCSVPGIQNIWDGIVPAQPQNGQITLRGFKLGTWAGETQLPVGCRYVDGGDNSQTLVSCDLTVDDVLNNKNDLKGRCHDKYGSNVVVHVPIPATAVQCMPDPSAAYGNMCPAQPWVL